jgi:hypothetical protein
MVSHIKGKIMYILWVSENRMLRTLYGKSKVMGGQDNRIMRIFVCRI